MVEYYVTGIVKPGNTVCTRDVKNVFLRFLFMSRFLYIFIF